MFEKKSQFQNQYIRWKEIIRVRREAYEVGTKNNKGVNKKKELTLRKGAQDQQTPNQNSQKCEIRPNLIKSKLKNKREMTLNIGERQGTIREYFENTFQTPGKSRRN